MSSDDRLALDELSDEMVAAGADVLADFSVCEDDAEQYACMVYRAMEGKRLSLLR